MMMNCSRAAETDAAVCACVYVRELIHTHTHTYRKTAEGESRESSHTDVKKEKWEEQVE